MPKLWRKRTWWAVEHGSKMARNINIWKYKGGVPKLFDKTIHAVVQMWLENVCIIFEMIFC